MEGQDGCPAFPVLSRMAVRFGFATHTTRQEPQAHWTKRSSSEKPAPPPGIGPDPAMRPPRNLAATLLLNLLVAFDFAVADRDDAVGVQSNIVFVRHQHNGVALLVEALE